MECLILAGLSMQLCGNSRPASGAEHHLSHFWEMSLVNQPCGALHGESVGCGTLLVARHYHAGRVRPRTLLPSCCPAVPTSRVYSTARISRRYSATSLTAYSTKISRIVTR